LALAWEDKVEARTRGTSPKILEIGAVPFMWRAFPDTAYDVEPGELTRAVTAAFADRERLHAIGAAAREHVRAFHTLAAIAQHIVDAAAEFAGRFAVSAADRGCPR
jgi:glycosyl transferase family 1